MPNPPMRSEPPEIEAFSSIPSQLVVTLKAWGKRPPHKLDAEASARYQSIDLIFRTQRRQPDLYRFTRADCRDRPSRGFGRGSAALSKPDANASYFAPAALPRACHRNIP